MLSNNIISNYQKRIDNLYGVIYNSLTKKSAFEMDKFFPNLLELYYYSGLMNLKGISLFRKNEIEFLQTVQRTPVSLEIMNRYMDISDYTKKMAIIITFLYSLSEDDAKLIHDSIK